MARLVCRATRLIRLFHSCPRPSSASPAAPGRPRRPRPRRRTQPRRSLNAKHAASSPDDGIAEPSDSLAFDLDGLPRRDLRVDAAHARRTGQHDVPGQQGEHLRSVRDEFGNREGELRRAAFARELAVDPRGQRQIGRVELGLDVRADGAERVRPLGDGEVRVDSGDVVGDGVPEDRLVGPLGTSLATRPMTTASSTSCTTSGRWGGSTIGSSGPTTEVLGLRKTRRSSVEAGGSPSG